MIILAMMDNCPEIQNILTTVYLGCALDLSYIATHSVNVEYKPATFGAVTMRLHEPKSTANIFASGNMVCLGTKDEKMAEMATKKFARIIRRLGFPVTFTNFRITNIVASSDLNFRPNFNDFYHAYKEFVDYNPETFPGLIYRNGVTIIVFKSGKVNLTNAKTKQQIYEAYTDFVQKISRKNINSTT